MLTCAGCSVYTHPPTHSSKDGDEDARFQVSCRDYWFRCGVPSSVPFRKSRFGLLLTLNAINWAALIFGFAQGNDMTDVGTFFLGIIIVNFFAYFGYYKVRRHCRANVLQPR